MFNCYMFENCHMSHKSGHEWVLLCPEHPPGAGLAQRQESAWMFSVASPDITHLNTQEWRCCVLCVPECNMSVLDPNPAVMLSSEVVAWASR